MYCLFFIIKLLSLIRNCEPPSPFGVRLPDTKWQASMPESVKRSDTDRLPELTRKRNPNIMKKVIMKNWNNNNQKVNGACELGAVLKDRTARNWRSSASLNQNYRNKVRTHRTIVQSPRGGCEMLVVPLSLRQGECRRGSDIMPSVSPTSRRDSHIGQKRRRKPGLHSRLAIAMPTMSVDERRSEN
jgi:hypothetical protein